MIIHYPINSIKSYINWDYFYYALGMHGKPDHEKQRLHDEAIQLLERYQQRYQAHAVFRLLKANSDGDDIVGEGFRLPFLRQQQGNPCLCISDFVRPLSSGQPDTIGVFATTVDSGMEHDFDDDPYLKMMMQLLADRLAEAAAERLHKEVRRTYWGYAPAEQLSIDDLHRETFQGIRPAVGYPSLPDTSLNFLINDILDMQQIGIHLTESGAMRPHASVSGLMIAHPQSRYFAIGKIDDTQLADYAKRRGMPIETVRKFLIANL
jgi:cobalamin-dependent methionine synthase I